MARERTLRVDIVADSKGFTKGTAEAERSVGKLETKLRGFGEKIGLTGAQMNRVFAVAGPAALATAGLAIGKFVTDGATKFRDLALAVNDFATTSGASLDDASRFVEVAGDKALLLTDRFITKDDIDAVRTRLELKEVDDALDHFKGDPDSAEYAELVERELWAAAQLELHGDPPPPRIRNVSSLGTHEDYSKAADGEGEEGEAAAHAEDAPKH